MAATEAQYIVYKLSTWTDTHTFPAGYKIRKVLLKQRYIILHKVY